MIKLHHKKRGFTLLELLVAVVLMLILVVAIVTIFNRTTEIFTIAESKMNVFQNARVALDLMSRELASARNDNNQFTIRNPEFTINTLPTPSGDPTVVDDFDILTFQTITSWENSSGLVEVRYRLQNDSSNRWNLIRRIIDRRDPADIQTFDGIIAQFIHIENNDSIPGIRVGFGYFNSSDTDTTSNDPLRPNTVAKSWNVTEPDEGTRLVFDNARLPETVRFTIDIQDRRGKIIRTLSRVFWLANGNISQ